MNLLADESVDWPIIDRLRHDGHSVGSIAELTPSVTDDDVLSRASAEGSLLLTADTDFGELVFRRGRLHHSGVVLLRLAGLSNAAKAARVSAVLASREAELRGTFSVIEPGSVRVRPLP